jgi:hypothetical protein
MSLGDPFLSRTSKPSKTMKFSIFDKNTTAFLSTSFRTVQSPPPVYQSHAPFLMTTSLDLSSDRSRFEKSMILDDF